MSQSSIDYCLEDSDFCTKILTHSEHTRYMIDESSIMKYGKMIANNNAIRMHLFDLLSKYSHIPPISFK